MDICSYSFTICLCVTLYTDMTWLIKSVKALTSSCQYPGVSKALYGHMLGSIYTMPVCDMRRSLLLDHLDVTAAGTAHRYKNNRAADFTKAASQAGGP